MNIAELFFYILGMFGLSYLMIESSGPFNIFDYIRRTLMDNKVVGTTFYTLFTCYFCAGCWSGLFMFLLITTNITLAQSIVWMMAGGTSSLFLNLLRKRLSVL